jgi:N-hydroxyarylamine O-acetyltransferase
MEEFAAMCRYHQTSPESPFVKKRVVTLATAEGRITLDERRLIITEHGVRREQPIEDEATYRRILEAHFAISL